MGSETPENSSKPDSSAIAMENGAEDVFYLLELAANDDAEGFRRFAETEPESVSKIGLWYGRKKGKMVLDQRTPLMVAATYGSVEVVKLILLLVPAADVNRSSGADKTTALHCAASSGSVHAVDVIRRLLAAGADPRAADSSGRRPCDVISASPNHPELKPLLEDLLGHRPSSPPLFCLDDVGSGSSDSASPPKILKFPDLQVCQGSEKKEYPADPSLPDIKNSIYSTDEFRMYSFKVRPCSRAYSHDWTECPFVHPGENARRRDPRKYHYSCVPCPDFRKGTCRRGDLCEYAHGVFECWLHPAQYRTRLCKDGTNCSRRVCFFAHTPEELRPLYMSSGSAVPSPRASSMEMAAAMNMLPGSPSSISMMSLGPLSPSAATNGVSHSSLVWPPQSNLPALTLPGSSRLRSSVSARDIPSDDFSDSQQLLNDFSGFSSPHPRLGRCKTMAPSNLDDLFASEMVSSPRYESDGGAMFSPSHEAAVLSQLSQQSLMQAMNSSNVFSPKSVDSPYGTRGGRFQPPFGISSPRAADHPLSPRNTRLAAFSQLENQQRQKLRSLSSRDMTSGSPSSPWGISGGKLDWGVNGDELGLGGHLFNQPPSSFEVGTGEEPDLSWVQSLVKESPSEPKDEASSQPPAAPSGAVSNIPADGADQTVLGAWLEQMQLDQLVAL